MTNDDLGPTGEFPHGKLSEDDEGALRVAISHDDAHNVRIEFGAQVAWFAFPRESAVDFALCILKHAGVSVSIK